MTELCEQTERPVDRAVVEGWVRAHGPAVLGYLMKLCTSRDRAEDCFQETFRKAVEKGHAVHPDHIRNWLYRVATNTAMDTFRKQSRQHLTPVSMAVAGDSTPGPAAQTVQAEHVAEVRAAVASLPDRQRTILVLAYYQKMSYREIAVLLDCSLGTVKTHMSRALATLAQRLRSLNE
jgi:RNA polymerase sigma-70 factor (ECF subfamily)